jgi:hypothetical protein
MNSESISQILAIAVPLLVGFLLKTFFPNIKLPTPTPADPAKPVEPKTLKEELADILPGLLDAFLRDRLPVRLPAFETVPGTSDLVLRTPGEAPLPVSISTPTHTIAVDASGAVSVAVK